MGKYSYFYTEFGIYFFFSVFYYACRYLIIKFIYCLVNYGVVLLLGIVSLMAGSTTGVPMSTWYGANQTATPPPSYTTTYATTSSCTTAFKYYTTKAPEFYSTTYAALTPLYYSAPSYYTI
jgi:hypothetical protein